VSKKTKRVERYLSSQVLEDLKLWKEVFLPVISKGISLNLVTYRHPSFVCWSDACPHGMSGMDHFRNAWRLPIPKEFREIVSRKNNCLEFSASFITIWQSIMLGFSQPEECFLSLGDNTLSVGWLHKASIDPSKNLPLFLATCQFATIMLHQNSCIYSQHIPGVSNKITDILSRRFDLSDVELTSYVFSYLPSQVPASFRICPVHPEIVSWTTYWLQKCREMKELQRIQKTRSAEYGDNGLLTQMQFDFHMTSGSQTSAPTNKPISLEPSQQPLGKENFLLQP